MKFMNMEIRINLEFSGFVIYPLDKPNPKYEYILNTKTQNIFCCLNENLLTFFIHFEQGRQENRRRKKFSYSKFIPKLNVTKIWVLVFSIRIWYLAYPTDRSQNPNFLNTLFYF